ncbi:MAG: hypothetical protein J6X40_03575 [Bacteroidales bacterium]|nr:hypothetical protein [Bacteroidales bacterium]
MSCFIVPLTQALATTAYRKTHEASIHNPKSSVLKRHLPALEKMLWGGSVMLVVDHIINGEVTWRYPFFTALESAGGGQIMLKEMLTVGLPMSLVLTLVWIGYALVKDHRAKKLSPSDI